MLMGLLFFTVLCHEFGHCFAARWMNGEAREVLLWPLGGLASVDVPHSPRAHFVTALGGPAVNLLICVLAALALGLFCNLQPPWNPISWSPYRDHSGSIYLTTWQGLSQSPTNIPTLLLAQLFFVSWATFLLNVLLMGYPLDGGRMLQAILWPYVGYRQAMLYTVFSGFGVMFLLVVVGLVANEVMILFLAFYIYVSCKQEWITLETGGEESLFGYDFSQGYTSLERDQPVESQVKPRKQNFIQRWLQRRSQKKLQRELEEREAEEKRMDELLEKIQRYGKESLTDEEQRFLKKVADRYRNRQ
jgi:Zn-dependent protease